MDIRDIIYVIVFVVIWIVVMRVILPRLGVPT
jgi:hypothetical protein